MSVRRGYVFSICLNLGLLATVGYLIKNRSANAPVPPEAGNAPPIRQEPAEKRERAPAAAKSAPKFDWRLVESEDYKKYIANLRSIGCPEETIRDIIIADVDKLFETRRQGLMKPDEGFKFWKTGQSMFGAVNPDQLQEELKLKHDLAQEKRAVLKELLGIDVPEKPERFTTGFNPYERLLGFLTPEKRTQLMELEQKFNAQRLKGLQGGSATSAEDLKKLEAQKSAELAKILTPQEIEEYQLRMSPTAMTMRAQLGGFDPTEQEFREVFRLKKKFDEEHGAMMGIIPGAVNEKRVADEQELEAQLKVALGEQRYNEFKREQDLGYRGAVQAAEQSGLTKATAVKVYDMKKTAEQQASKIRSDTTLSDEQRHAALQAIRVETEKTLAQTLGEKGFDLYKKQFGAYWIQTLAPKEPQP